VVEAKRLGSGAKRCWLPSRRIGTVERQGHGSSRQATDEDAESDEPHDPDARSHDEIWPDRGAARDWTRGAGGSDLRAGRANGAGKTTMIKLLMNILRPTAGGAEVLGVDTQRLAGEVFNRIGYVSENQEMPMR